MARAQDDQRDLVAGIFDDQDSASGALAALIDAHYDPQEDISVLLKDEWTGEREEVAVREKMSLFEGAKVGGSIGAALGATGAGLVGAGILGGPVALVVAGPLVAALQGALAGGAFGTFSGWLVGAGLMKEDADLHAADLERGAVWVGVHATGERVTLARDILERSGAERITRG